MEIVPLQVVPSQQVAVGLGGQNCQLNVYQLATGLFVDVYVDSNPIAVGVRAENLNRIVRAAYTGFIGDLCFIDNQGNSDPDYLGLGGRYSLAYLSPADVAEEV